MAMSDRTLLFLRLALIGWILLTYLVAGIVAKWALFLMITLGSVGVVALVVLSLIPTRTRRTNDP